MTPRKKTASKPTAAAGRPKNLATNPWSSVAKFLRKRRSPSRSKKICIFINSAHYMSFPGEHSLSETSGDFRHYVRLSVKPTLKIAALKTILKSYHWIPKENLVLVSQDGKIELITDGSADGFTLGQCGIKDRDTLLACMEDGSFTTYIYSNMDMGLFPVSIDSCFQTVGDLKKKICEVKGYSPDVQVLTRCTNHAPLDDQTPLVALGIVKPYLKEMELKLPVLKLVGPVSRRDISEKGPLIIMETRF